MDAAQIQEHFDIDGFENRTAASLCKCIMELLLHHCRTMGKRILIISDMYVKLSHLQKNLEEYCMIGYNLLNVLCLEHATKALEKLLGNRQLATGAKSKR